MAAILIFKCTEGEGVGDYICRGEGAEKRFRASSRTAPARLLVSSFDTHARWQPVTQNPWSRPPYGKIEDCEQSNKNPVTFHMHIFNTDLLSACNIGQYCLQGKQ